MRIIDSETHPVSPSGLDGCYPMDIPWRNPYVPGALPHTREVIGKALANNEFDFLTDQLLARMDELGVEKAVIMRGAFPAYNTDLQKVVRQYPDRFVAFAGWDLEMPAGSPPHETWQSIEALETGLRDLGCVGAGEFDLGRFHPTPVGEAWTGFIPTMELCRKYNVPAMFHTSYDGSPIPLTYKNPLAFEALASEYRDVPVLIAHMGKFDTSYFEAAMMLARKCRNVYLTTSNTRREFIERAVEEIGPERIIFGSDWSMQHGILGGRKGFDVYAENIERVREAALSQRDKELILGENLAGLLDL